MSPHPNSRSSSIASQEGLLSRKNSETISKSPLSGHQGSDLDLMTSPMSYSESCREGIAPNESMLARAGLACDVMMNQAMVGTDAKSCHDNDMYEPVVASQVRSEPAVASQVMSELAVASHGMYDPSVESHGMSAQDAASQVISDLAVTSQAMANPAVESQVLFDQIMASKALLNRAMAEQNRLEQIMAMRAQYNEQSMASHSTPHPLTTNHSVQTEMNVNAVQTEMDANAVQTEMDVNANTTIMGQANTDLTAPTLSPQGVTTQDTPEQLPSITAMLAQLTRGTPGGELEGGDAMGSDGEEEEDEGAANDGTEDEALHRTAGGVKKRTKRFRLTKPKKTKRNHRARKDALEKVLREEVDEAGFVLSDLTWSPWKQAIRRSVPNKDSWEKRPGNHMGARCKRLYDDMSMPAVYEVAVKTPASDTKVPVLATVTGGNTKGHWETNLLSKPKVKAQVDRVLHRGCKLYLRRASFAGRDLASVYERCDVKRKSAGRVPTQDAVHELRGLISKVCDYAWRDHYDVDSRTYSHRGLIVDGVKVSD